MAKSYKKQSITTGAKYYLFDCFRQSRIKIIITIFVMFVSLITGIILAVKYNSDLSMNLLNDYGIVDFVGSGVTTSFFSRLLSIILIMVILFGCSYLNFLLPLVVVILAFRTYLLGFNLCLMFMIYGLPGIIISLFIILPCQLVILLLLCSYYFLLVKSTCDLKQFGGCSTSKERLKISLLLFLFMICICLVETILLLIFNASVIIVI